EPGQEAVQLGPMGEADLAAVDQRAVEAGAAHVGGDDAVEAVGTAQVLGSDHAADRPRVDQADRPLLRLRGGDPAADRLYQGDRRVVAAGGELALEAVDV